MQQVSPDEWKRRMLAGKRGADLFRPSKLKENPPPPRRRNIAFESAHDRDAKIRAAVTMAELDECAAEFGMTFEDVYARHKELFRL